MTNIKRLLFIILSVSGVFLLILGGFVITSENLKMISGLCIGIGSAAAVLGIGSLIRSFVVSPIKQERMKRLIAIEVNDERNIKIKEKSGYMVSRIMNYLLCALVLVLGFMNVDKIVIILIASLPLANLILVILFSNYYSKVL